MMSLKALAFLGTALVALTLAGSAQAEEFDVAGHRLRIETFDGYCPVERNDPVGEALYDLIESGSGGTEAVLSIQADCAVLERFWKASQPVRLQPALAVQIDLTNGRAAASSLTRDEFLAMKAAVLKRDETTSLSV